MARPKRVYPNSLPQYDKMITDKVKMMSRVFITALYLVKETAEYYISIDSWAFCCSQFKKKKKNVPELKVTLPTVTDERVQTFLDKHAWHKWVEKELATTQVNIFSKDKEIVPHTPNSDTIETLALLDKLFPKKKKIFFYELDSIIASYCHGNFISYDDDGNIEEPTKHDIEKRGYYTQKYRGMLGRDRVENPKAVEDLYKAYQKLSGNKKKEKECTEAFGKYYDAERNFLMENHDLTDVFIKLGENTVVCPYIFTDCCVKGSSYENAGEIYMIITPDTVYFQTNRHF